MIYSYTINLSADIARRKYMDGLLAGCSFLENRFIDAVYGKLLNKDELEEQFDLPESFRRYGRELSPGEIGCTLSHFKCYRTLLADNKPYVLILEDDVTILCDFSIAEKVASVLPADEPWVLFLSADYWFTSLHKFNDDISLANVYDAVGTYAYMINRKGAELLLRKNARPSCVADNWSLYRQQGLKLYAVNPYMIDANIESFDSTICQTYFGEIRKNMPFGMKVKSYWLSIVKRILLKRGHFVAKIRK